MEQENYEGFATNNQGYNSSSALQIRLETEQLHEQIELFLRGQKINIKEGKNGKIIAERIPVGKPKANDEGIQAILSWLKLIINPQVVQGNFASDSPNHSSSYENYVFWAEVNLVCQLTTNSYEWDIKDTDIQNITNQVMLIVSPFMTRLIDNKERESYESTIRHVESNKIQETTQGKGIFGLFGRS